MTCADGPLFAPNRPQGLSDLSEVLIGYNNQAIQYDREKIGYWQSDQAFEELNRKKDSFYTESCQQHYGDHLVPKETTGLTLTEAISQMSFDRFTGFQDLQDFRSRAFNCAVNGLLAEMRVFADQTD